MSELTDDYSAAGFGGSLDFGLKPAVILIDVARAYIEPDAPLYVGSEEAFQSMRKLAEMARAANVPVIWTRVEYRPGGADGGLFYQKVPVLSVFDEGNPLGDFDPRLQPADDELVITKQYPSAFFGTSLTSTLNMLRVDTCLLAGFRLRVASGRPHWMLCRTDFVPSWCPKPAVTGIRRFSQPIFSTLSKICGPQESGRDFGLF